MADTRRRVFDTKSFHYVWIPNLSAEVQKKGHRLDESWPNFSRQKYHLPPCCLLILFSPFLPYWPHSGLYYSELIGQHQFPLLKFSSGQQELHSVHWSYYLLSISTMPETDVLHTPPHFFVWYITVSISEMGKLNLSESALLPTLPIAWVLAHNTMNDKLRLMTIYKGIPTSQGLWSPNDIKSWIRWWLGKSELLFQIQVPWCVVNFLFQQEDAFYIASSK